MLRSLLVSPQTCSRLSGHRALIISCQANLLCSYSRAITVLQSEAITRRSNYQCHQLSGVSLRPCNAVPNRFITMASTHDAAGSAHAKSGSDLNPDRIITDILKTSKVIALVGASASEGRQLDCDSCSSLDLSLVRSGLARWAYHPAIAACCSALTFAHMLTVQSHVTDRVQRRTAIS